MSKRGNDASLITFLSFLYQMGGWWLLLAKEAAVLAFGLFFVALLLGLYGVYLRRENGPQQG